MMVERAQLIRRVATRLAIVLALLAPTGYLGVSLLSAHLLTRPHNRPPGLDIQRYVPEAAAWSTRTADGLTLRGWYLPTRDHRRLIVLVHGLWAGWDKMADIGIDLNQRGYDVLLFDLRGHGQSDPARLSMGKAERLDLRAILAWADRHGFPSERVGWLGQSMGASTILMEGVDNPKIRAVVADSPYGDLPELLETQLGQHSHLPHAFNPGILFAAHRAFGLDAEKLVPIRLVNHHWGDRPILLLHGEADTTVPIQQARLLAKALGPSCRMLTWPGVEHVEIYRDDPDRYIDLVDDFFRQNLTPSRPGSLRERAHVAVDPRTPGRAL
ncbi:MAG: alpha/beta fold hydrolase [Isosphaeraceae bacterium]